MNRFEKKTDPAIFAAIAVTLAAVFAVDVWTIVGVTTWMFYLIPVSLCLFAQRPELPIGVGLVASGLTVADYFLSPAGVDPWISQLNRGFGLLILWTVVAQARQIIVVRRRLERQSWLRSGQAGLAERTRGDLSLHGLSQRVLDFVAGALDAQVGVLYAAEPDLLRRTAGFALARDVSEDENRGAAQNIAWGEGLVGQTASENRLLHVRGVPPRHLSVYSGLGTSRPATLVLAPATSDGSVAGVIELGFFRDVGDAELELLEQLAEPIGIALRTAQLRRQRQDLLEETQRQAEELQAQQEELRVSNEELEQQSNDLRESQTRLELQQSEVEQANARLEEQTQRLAQQNEELGRTQSTLLEKASELERVNRFKSEFLANMSHELRTPLNSSLILAKLLSDNREGNLSEEQVRFAQNIYAAGNDLLGLITDILDLSKVEAGKLDVVVTTVAIGPLLEGLVETFAPLAREKALELSCHIDPGTPAAIASDGQRLGQVLKNLLSNALKFTEQGTISVRAGEAPDGGVALSVQDTGIGIEPDQHEVIFEPFRQADGTTNRRHGGTGLGLSISRQLVELLGGRIELQSTPGAGSRFTVILPAVLPESPSAPGTAPLPALAPPPLEPSPLARRAAPPPAPAHDDRERITDARRVLLVVEDDPAFARILYDLAHSLDLHCLVAHTADEGIELALRHRPAAIVLDVRLPDHSGLTVLDRLKHNPSTRHIPVQIVSAFDHTREALEMGAAGVSLKPIDRDQLLDTLSQLETRFAAGVRSVLVVEDNAVQRESVCHLLGSHSVRTVPVATAAAALDELRRATFDCMVLDLALPDASGYELLEKMAREELYAFPPVIVYTGRSLSPDEEQKLRRYSRSIIIKGAKSPERLLDEVTLFLHQIEETLPPDHQRMLRDARSRDTTFEGRRILIAEDDVRNIFALSSVLEPRGATLEIARNGREALEALRASVSTPDAAIDLVLMDLMMPELDGIEATRRIRGELGLSQLPIIALTAKAMPDDRQRCLDAGASDYITKPVDVEKLLSLIRIWLPKRTAADA